MDVRALMHFLQLQGLGGTRKVGTIIFQTFQGLVEMETLTKKKVCEV